jgi:hypothetical protein
MADLEIRMFFNQLLGCLTIFEPFSTSPLLMGIGPGWPLVEGKMAKLRIAIAAALMLCAFIPVSAAQARDNQCTHTLAQHTEALRILESEAAKAQALAQQNPLYEADVGYYTSVLRDARQCVKTLSPMVSASR